MLHYTYTACLIVFMRYVEEGPRVRLLHYTVIISIITVKKRMNSGFRHEVDENCARLGYYAASGGNSLPTFRDNVSIPSLRPLRWD